MADYTRRRFLQDTLLATAAMAAGPASSSFAREKRKEKKGRMTTCPSDKLGVMVLGVKGRGQAHINAFLDRDDTEILCICDADEACGHQRVEEIAKRQGRKPKFVRDMREAYEDKSIDIVSIAAPNHWHALASIWAMQAGKDVYVEKPVSHNITEGRRIVEAARKYKKICQVGTQCRSMDGMIEAIKYVHDGKIGEVKLARGLCYKPRKPIGEPGVYQPPKSVDYNLWLGPAPMAPLTRPQFHYDWNWQSPYGNGDVGNQSSHQMDIARWGLKLDRLSNRVVSYAGRIGPGWNEDAGDTANIQVVIHEFGDKALVFEVRNMASEPLMGVGIGVIFYGSEGYVVLPNYEGGVAMDKDKKVVKTFKAGGDHFANFVKAVRSRKHEDLNADVLEGHLSAALCHMANISWRLGKKVPFAEVEAFAKSYKGNENAVDTIDRTREHLKANGVDLGKPQLGLGPWLDCDPKKEEFVGNAAANAMLTRDYRKPFVVPAAGEV
jgi:predicted dehydrogenase